MTEYICCEACAEAGRYLPAESAAWHDEQARQRAAGARRRRWRRALGRGPR